MLSRVADNLFWLGRYLERSEHLTRYLSVQYFSSIDVPYQQQRERAIISILEMVGMTSVSDKPLEEEVLVAVALDEKNPVSILSSAYFGRENARSVRDSISTELWEEMNNYYLFVSGYPVDVYKTKGLFDFTSNVIKHCSIVRGKIQDTLMHDASWSFIQLGMHLERSIQVIRILMSKIKDIQTLNDFKLGGSLELQQWNILLDCLEAKDMYRKFYNALPNRLNTLEFLLLNPEFPRSVSFNLTNAHEMLEKISLKKQFNKTSLEYRVGKDINHFRYLEAEEVEGNVIPFLEDTLQKIHLICDLIVDEYFIY
jgi:uncharacterized alpha-E superfamily protein